MNSTASSETSPHFQLMDYLQKKGRLKLWGGALAMEHLQDESERQRKNIAAEDAAVRKTMGWEQAAESNPQHHSPDDESEAMRQTVLGDINHPTPMIFNSPPAPASNGLGPLLALAIGSFIPGAGLAGYLLADLLQPDTQPVPPQPAPVVSDDTGESVNLGLGRLEDYTTPAE